MSSTRIQGGSQKFGLVCRQSAQVSTKKIALGSSKSVYICSQKWPQRAGEVWRLSPKKGVNVLEMSPGWQPKNCFSVQVKSQGWNPKTWAVSSGSIQGGSQNMGSMGRQSVQGGTQISFSVLEKGPVWQSKMASVYRRNIEGGTQKLAQYPRKFSTFSSNNGVNVQAECRGYQLKSIVSVLGKCPGW